MAGAPSEGARFEVSLVPHDAREGESLHAALDALVRLSDVANSTFTVYVATQDDLVRAVSKGVVVENYKAPEQTKLELT
jgi:hypothetical protein